MWKDEVLEEIYKIREEHAKAFNYDLHEICQDLRKKQVAKNRKVITQPLVTLSSSTKQAIAKRSAGIAIWDMGERSLDKIEVT